MTLCFTISSFILDDTSRQATALKVLVEVLTNTKKLTSALSLIYEEREVSGYVRHTYYYNEAVLQRKN